LFADIIFHINFFLLCKYHRFAPISIPLHIGSKALSSANKSGLFYLTQFISFFIAALA